jgi:DNA excision repair protein ERCC-4
MSISKIKSISIDMPREKRVGHIMVKHFKSKGYNVIEETLSIGDIVVRLDTGEELFLERKEIGDFFGSYLEKDGKSRLRNQAIKLNKYQYSAILSYGNPLHVKKVNSEAKYFTLSSFHRMKANIMLNYKVPVFHTMGGVTEFLQMMDSIIKSFQKYASVNIETKNRIIRSKTGNIKSDILCCGNNMGEKKAELLLNKFKTPEKVFKASDKDILAIKGVGKALLNNIRKLEREFYGNSK